MKIGHYDVKVTVRANARRMILRCRPTEGVVTLTVPRGSSETQVRRMLEEHLPWIREHMGEQATWQPAYVRGERHWCLGRLVTLGKDAPCGQADFLAWRDGQLSSTLQQLLDRWMPRLHIQEERIRRVTVREMSSRWGSCCAARGTLNFSRKLALYEPALIEETVVHELCHFYHQNHSEAFYALLGRSLPDWKARKQTRDGRDVRPRPPEGR